MLMNLLDVLRRLPGRLGKPAAERCRDLAACLRIDSPTCCADRIAAAQSLERLRDERLIWGG